MPKAADEKGKHQIKAMTDFPHPVSAQRDIEIIPEPGGKGNMPTAPEFLDTAGKIGGLFGGRRDFLR